MEAMAAGLPVVASAAGGIPELVEDGVTGFVVEPGRAEPVAEALATLLADPARAAAMGAEGRRRARERLSRETMTARLVELYDAMPLAAVGRTRASEARKTAAASRFPSTRAAGPARREAGADRGERDGRRRPAPAAGAGAPPPPARPARPAPPTTSGSPPTRSRGARTRRPGTKRTRRPSCRARQHRSRSSAYMNVTSSKPPSARHVSPSTSSTGPAAAWTSRSAAWSQCVLQSGCRRFGTKRLSPGRLDERDRRRVQRRDARLQRQVLVQEPRDGDADARVGERVEQPRDRAGAVDERVAVDEQVRVAVEARGSQVDPAREADVLVERDELHVRKRGGSSAALPSVEPLSTTTTRAAGTPSATSARHAADRQLRRVPVQHDRGRRLTVGAVTEPLRAARGGPLARQRRRDVRAEPRLDLPRRLAQAARAAVDRRARRSRAGRRGPVCTSCHAARETASPQRPTRLGATTWTSAPRRRTPSSTDGSSWTARLRSGCAEDRRQPVLGEPRGDGLQEDAARVRLHLDEHESPADRA